MKKYEKNYIIKLLSMIIYYFKVINHVKIYTYK